MENRGELIAFPTTYEQGVKELFDIAENLLEKYRSEMNIGWSDRRLALAAANSDGADRYYIYPARDEIEFSPARDLTIVMSHRRGNVEDETWFGLSGDLLIARNKERTQEMSDFPKRKYSGVLTIDELLSLSEEIRTALPLNWILDGNVRKNLHDFNQRQREATGKEKAPLVKHIGAILRYARMVPEQRPNSYKDLIR